jgi:hypothetical protein
VSSNVEGELMLRGARHATWRHTPPRLHHWRDDLTQDVVLYALNNRQMAGRTGAQCYSWAAKHAIRRLCYLLRGQVELADDWDVPVDAPHELHPLPLWRLQRVWCDLTDLERLALQQLMTDESPVHLARQLGVGQPALFRARRTALGRIDEPGAYPRSGRSYQRIRTDVQRAPTDEARVAAWKARDRAYARAQRAKRRQAQTKGAP